MRFVPAIVIALFVSLQFSLWFGDKGAVDLYTLRQQITEMSESNQELLQRNSQLDYEIRDLKEGTDAIEERARAELGLIKRGETFYQIVTD